MEAVTHYRDYTITYDPPPIPVRSCDWSYVHKDYDGAEDSNDNRYGHAASVEAAQAEIDDLIEESSTLSNPHHDATRE